MKSKSGAGCLDLGQGAGHLNPEKYVCCLECEQCAGYLEPENGAGCL
jgi:hypothetical protein